MRLFDAFSLALAAPFEESSAQEARIRKDLLSAGTDLEKRLFS